MNVCLGESEIHGKGVFAQRHLHQGQVILIFDDSRIVDDDHPLANDESSDYCDYLPNGAVVLMQEPERHINHSCSPNVYVYSTDQERYLLAMSDIEEGVELTYDYSINAVEGDIWECGCGAANCRGEHKCDFFCLPLERQTQYLPYLDPWFAQVHEDRIKTILQSTVVS
ncbi:MAG: SET domain-containing protein-lysine N-methyltransferase [Pseudomonadales bacterium]|nr:SET domain-containing protein-lysine N-methyltransferase [Pseudomonadales bacterium]